MPNSEDSDALKADIANMKVVELRAALQKRGLDISGLKSALAARLLEALEAEAHVNNNAGEDEEHEENDQHEENEEHKNDEEEHEEAQEEASNNSKKAREKAKKNGEAAEDNLAAREEKLRRNMEELKEKKLEKNYKNFIKSFEEGLKLPRRAKVAAAAPGDNVDMTPANYPRLAKKATRRFRYRKGKGFIKSRKIANMLARSRMNISKRSRNITFRLKRMGANSPAKVIQHIQAIRSAMAAQEARRAELKSEIAELSRDVAKRDSDFIARRARFEKMVGMLPSKFKELTVKPAAEALKGSGISIEAATAEADILIEYRTETDKLVEKKEAAQKELMLLEKTLQKAEDDISKKKSSLPIEIIRAAQTRKKERKREEARKREEEKGKKVAEFERNARRV